MNKFAWLFRRHDPIEILDRDLTKEESRIIIYDLILMVVVEGYPAGVRYGGDL